MVSRVTIIFLLLFGFRFRNIPIRLLSHLYALMFIACVFLAIMILFLHNFVSVFISIVTHFGYFEVSSRLFLFRFFLLPVKYFLKVRLTLYAFLELPHVVLSLWLCNKIARHSVQCPPAECVKEEGALSLEPCFFGSFCCVIIFF